MIILLIFLKILLGVCLFPMTLGLIFFYYLQMKHWWYLLFIFCYILLYSFCFGVIFSFYGGAFCLGALSLLYGYRMFFMRLELMQGPFLQGQFRYKKDCYDVSMCFPIKFLQWIDRLIQKTAYKKISIIEILESSRGSHVFFINEGIHFQFRIY